MFEPWQLENCTSGWYCWCAGVAAAGCCRWWLWCCCRCPLRARQCHLGGASAMLLFTRTSLKLLMI